MRPDGLRGIRGGVFYETPEAWEILEILDRQMLDIGTMLGLLARFSSRDLHAAYGLTRRQAELERRRILVDGEDAGRAARIRARNILARAHQQNLLAERTNRGDEEAQRVVDDIRGSPPTSIGTHLRSPHQVLILAGSTQPLPVRLRRLLAVQPERLSEALQRLQALPHDAWLRSGWPSRQERPLMRRLLELAIQLQRELMDRPNT